MSTATLEAIEQADKAIDDENDAILYQLACDHLDGKLDATQIAHGVRACQKTIKQFDAVVAAARARRKYKPIASQLSAHEKKLATTEAAIKALSDRFQIELQRHEAAMAQLKAPLAGIQHDIAGAIDAGRWLTTNPPPTIAKQERDIAERRRPLAMRLNAIERNLSDGSNGSIRAGILRREQAIETAGKNRAYPKWKQAKAEAEADLANYLKTVVTPKQAEAESLRAELAAMDVEQAKFHRAKLQA